MSTPADFETAPAYQPPPPPTYIGPPLPALTQPYDFRDYNTSRISYIRTPDQAKTVLGSLQSGPLGFDLEWRPTYQKGAPENPVALIQLANDRSILLFQVSCMHRFPPELKRILECPETVKAGVGIQGDARKLFKDCKISMRNCVDLSLLARTVDNPKWAGRYNSPIGLARLIACYEYKSLVKGKVSRSDWTAVLNSKQQQYASNDAHAGYTLYKKFEAMMLLMPSMPKAAWYSFDISEGNLCTGGGLLWEAENPDYDPGPLPDPKPPTEAQLRRKRKKEEDRATQQAFTQVEGVDPIVETQLKPVFPISNQLPTSFAVGNRNFSPLVPIPAKIASGFTTRQVSGYHHSAQDQHFQPILTNRSGPVYHPQNTAEVSHGRPFSGTSRRSISEKQYRKNRHPPRSGHVSNRFDTRDNLGPPATQLTGSP